MLKSQIVKAGLVATSISLLAACAPTETPTTPGQPSAEPSATATPPSTEPSDEPSTEPSASAEPSTEPSASAEPSTEPSTDPSASVEPTPTPLPTATSDISVIERTTFNGQVNDDTSAPLDGVTVTAKSLNSSVPFEETTTTAGGSYAFNNAPAGVQLEIIASRPGYTTRRRVEVLKSNKQGDPNANKYDFGPGTTNGSVINALSDLPEVTKVAPGRNAAGVDPKTSFVLTFSEPMDKKSVEDTFGVRGYNNRKLTVDSGSAVDTITGSGDIATVSGMRIWNKDAFNISWNSDDTEVTFSFKEDRLLPTDKDTNLVPDYQVAFQNFNIGTDRTLKDKSGISRTNNHFKLTDGPFEQTYKFSIQTDTQAPTLSSVTAQTQEGGGLNGDSIVARFSERMIIPTRDRSIAGGMDGVAGSATRAPAEYPGQNNSNVVAQNYRVIISVQGGNVKYDGTWGDLGGTAVYDTTDLTGKTILLRPSTAGTTVGAAPFAVLAAGPQANFLSFNATNVNGVTTATPIDITTANANQVAYTEIVAGLNAAFGAGTASISAIDTNGITKDTTNPATLVAAGDRFAINLTTAAMSGGAAVRSISVSGGTAREILGMNVGLSIIAGTSSVAGQRSDYYKSGDNIEVIVNNTVLDPAGNSIDTTNNRASANAL